jgi:hypothetical protein
MNVSNPIFYIPISVVDPGSLVIIFIIQFSFASAANEVKKITLI